MSESPGIYIEDKTVRLHMPGFEQGLETLRQFCIERDLPIFQTEFALEDADVTVSNIEIIAHRFDHYPGESCRGTAANLRSISQQIRQAVDQIQA